MNDPWSGILEPGETILWQGRPDGRLHWTPGLKIVVALGLLMCVLGLVTTGLVTAQDGFSGEAFGAGFFLAFPGLFAMIVPPLVWRYRLRRTWYTLTDRRAIVATAFMGERRLSSYPISGWQTLDLIDGDPATIFFAEETTTTRNRSTGRATSNTRRIGFQFIAEGRSVYAQMRALVEGLSHV